MRTMIIFLIAIFLSNTVFASNVYTRIGTTKHVSTPDSSAVPMSLAKQKYEALKYIDSLDGVIDLKQDSISTEENKTQENIAKFDKCVETTLIATIAIGVVWLYYKLFTMGPLL